MLALVVAGERVAVCGSKENKKHPKNATAVDLVWLLGSPRSLLEELRARHANRKAAEGPARLPVKVGSNAVPSVGSKKIGGAEPYKIAGAPLHVQGTVQSIQDWNCVGDDDFMLVFKENCGLNP